MLPSCTSRPERGLREVQSAPGSADRVAPTSPSAFARRRRRTMSTRPSAPRKTTPAQAHRLALLELHRPAAVRQDVELGLVHRGVQARHHDPADRAEARITRNRGTRRTRRVAAPTAIPATFTAMTAPSAPATRREQRQPHRVRVVLRRRRAPRAPARLPGTERLGGAQRVDPPLPPASQHYRKEDDEQAGDDGERRDDEGDIHLSLRLPGRGPRAASRRAPHRRVSRVHAPPVGEAVDEHRRSEIGYPRPPSPSTRSRCSRRGRGRRAWSWRPGRPR